ncbi:ABC transporter permease [Candidatus Mycoplasma pogonae]
MLIFIAKRIFLAIIAMLAILFIVYVLQATFGKNPLDSMIADSGNNAFGDKGGPGENFIIDPVTGAKIPKSEFLAKEFYIKYGFDKPVIERFFIWFGNIFKGDFGDVYNPTINFKLPSSFFEGLKFSSMVTIPVFFFSLILGISLGILAAYNRGKFIDNFILVFTSVMASIPVIALIPLFRKWGYDIGLPFEFRNSLVDPTVSYNLMILSLITPIFVFTLVGLSGYTVVVRNQVVTVLTSNHVLIAKAKGLTTSQIFWKHVLRNILVPISGSIIGGYLVFLSGSIVFERYFGIPGVSEKINEALQKGEVNILMFQTLFYVSLGMLGSILTEISWTIIDPNVKSIRISGSGQLMWIKKLKTKIKLRKEVELLIHDK